MTHTHYNPDNPMVVGNQYAPVLGLDYTPELFVERGYQFRAPIADTQYRWMSMYVSQLPPWPVPGHGYLFTLYRRGQETNTGPMRRTIVPVSATATANVAVVGGGGSATTALANPTDNAYVRLGVNNNEAYIRCGFDTGAGSDAEAAIAGKRIVNLSLLYSTSAEPGNESPLPVNVFHRRTSDAIRINMGQLDIPLQASSLLTTQTHRMGELNSYDDPLGNDPLTQVNYRLPWRYSGRGLFDLRSAGDQTIEIQVAAAAPDGPREIYVNYAALEVTYCEENRLGVVGFVRGADYDATCVVSPNGYSLGRNTFCGGGGMTDPQTGAAGATFLDTYQGTITIKRSDYGPYNNAGPPGKLAALRTIEPFPDHPGVIITNTGAEGEIPAFEVTDLVPQIILHDPDGPAFFFSDDPPLPWSHPYGAQIPLDVYSGQDAVQEIVQTAEAPDTAYPNIRFWARSQDAASPLRVAIETASQGPVTVASITPDEWAALPEIIDGWRLVELAVDTALIVDDDGTILAPAAPRWSSDTAQFRPWQILAERVDPVPMDSGAPSDTGIGTYGNDDAEGGIEGDLPATADIDAAVAWSVDMPEVTGLAAALEIQELAPADPECPGDRWQIPTGIYYAALTWDVVPDGVEFTGLDHYELARRDTSMPAGQWETIATPAHALIAGFDDYEARVGVDTSYRIRYVHRTGVAGPWSEPVTVTIQWPGVVNDDERPCPALVFTSNANPASNLAYPTSWSGPVEQSFTFLEAEQRILQRLHRRDYQTAFRPSERGGVQFTRALLVNSVAVTPETLRRNFEDLRDLAWADLPYVCVRDRHADRWLTNINVPSGTVRNRQQLHVAEVVITETTDTPYAPSPTTCEGLTSAGGLPGVIYDQRYALTGAGADLDSVDALTVTAGVRLPDVTQLVPLAARYDQSAGRGWAVWLEDRFASDAAAIWFLIDDTTDQAQWFSDDLPYGPGELFYVRVSYAANAPGGPATIVMETSVDRLTWIPVAANAITTDPVSPTFTDLPLTVGAVADGTVDFPFGPTGGAGGWNGVITDVTVAGDTGALASPDFAEQAPGTAQFVDDEGNLWFVSGGLCEAPDE